MSRVSVRSLFFTLVLLVGASGGLRADPVQQVPSLLAATEVGPETPLDYPAKLVVDGAPLDNALDLLQARSGVSLVYSPSRLPRREVTCQCYGVKVGDALARLLDNTGLDFVVHNDYVIIESSRADGRFRTMPPAGLIATTFEQATPAVLADYTPAANEPVPMGPVVRVGTVTGVVRDATTLQPLAGAQVQISDLQIGTLTQANGRFLLVNVPAGTHTLEVGLIGYVRASEQISVADNAQTTLDFALRSSAIALDEVVVIGYGTQTRRTLTGSVATVRAEEIEQVTAGGLQEALQGRVAGVTITPTSGQPGGALDMTIRGVATFGSGNPLFVIDGVPVLTDGSTRNVNPLAAMNPDNIQSIQILKDASASAIYGARAANGVVIITTNRGASRPAQIQFSSSRSVSEVDKFLPLMTTEQWIPFSTEAFRNAGRPIPVAFQEPLLSKNLQQNTDWQGEGFESAITENYTLGASGGTENITYAVSGGYFSQGGTLPNSVFERYSARINTDFQISSKLRVGESVELSRAVWNGTFNQASFTIRQLLQQAPTVPVRNPSALGGFDGPRLEYGPVGRQNSIGHLSLDVEERTENKVFGSAYAEYELLPGLTNRLHAGGEVTFANTEQFLPTFDMGDRVRTLAVLNQGSGNNNVSLIENVTTYTTQFGGVHDVSILGGITRQSSWTEDVGVQVRGFPNNDLRTIAAAVEQRNITGNETGWALLSQIARLNYGYGDRYNAMFTIRRDGSSRFGANNRYGIFPSLSASWVVTNEPFMPDIAGLSHLRVRASHGQVGNQDISDFAQYATIETGVDYVFGTGQGRIPGSTYLSLGNPDLKWEVTTQSDIGVDLAVLDDQLSFEFDYYLKDTDDILLQLPIPTTSGIRRNNGPFVNAGSVRNTGFELSGRYQGRLLGDVAYGLSANIARNRNRVTSLEGDLPIIARLASGKQEALTMTRVGDPIGSFYGYIMEGVFRDAADLAAHATQAGSAPGDVKFRDVNGDGAVTPDDMTIIGNPFPDFTYGGALDLGYRNFDFSILINGKKGHDLYNLVWADLNEGEGDNNATTEMLDRWTPDNRDTNVPRAITGNPGQNTRPSTRFIEDGSFLRIQNILLGYNLGGSLAEKLRVARARIYVSANNLATFTDYKGYNPEIGLLTSGSRSSLTRGIDFGMYPIPRRIETGLQIDF